MTRQTWTAFVSAVAFVALALLLVVIPVPFVSWSPAMARDTLGTAANEPIINVSGNIHFGVLHFVAGLYIRQRLFDLL